MCMNQLCHGPQPIYREPTPPAQPKESVGREWTVLGGEMNVSSNPSKPLKIDIAMVDGPVPAVNERVQVIEKSTYLAVCRERDELMLNIEQSEPQFKTLIRERDEALDLAYIGEHHFPDNLWKTRCLEVEANRAQLRIDEAELELALDKVDKLAIDWQKKCTIVMAERDQWKSEHDNLSKFAAKEHKSQLTSALAAIGHLRSAARNLITAWCDGEDIVTAVGALEFALSISEFAEDLRQKYQALLPPSSD